MIQAIFENRHFYKILFVSIIISSFGCNTEPKKPLTSDEIDRLWVKENNISQLEIIKYHYINDSTLNVLPYEKEILIYKHDGNISKTVRVSRNRIAEAPYQILFVSTFEYDKTGRLVRNHHTAAGSDSDTIEFFNEKSTVWKIRPDSALFTYKYMDSNLVTSSEMYIDNELRRRTIYMYDSIDQLIQEDEYGCTPFKRHLGIDPDSIILMSSTRYSYIESGNKRIVQHSFPSVSTRLDTHIVFHKTDNGFMEENRDGLFIYDNQGFLMERRSRRNVQKYTYKFNEKELPVERIMTSSNSAKKELAKYSYTFFD